MAGLGARLLDRNRDRSALSIETEVNALLLQKHRFMELDSLIDR